MNGMNGQNAKENFVRKENKIVQELARIQHLEKEELDVQEISVNQEHVLLLHVMEVNGKSLIR